MTQESVDDVLADLRDILNEAAAAQAFSNFGLAQVDRVIAAGPRSAENPDPAVYIGIGDPNDPTSKQYAVFRASQIPGLVKKGGPISTQLGHQWAVFVFTEWETNLRPRLAAASGSTPDEIQADVFGDLRCIRHDILHHHGIASAEWSGRCRILRWFRPGSPVVIEAEHIAEFMRLVPWDELKSGPATPPATGGLAQL
jgi:hypothetical protein